jgi:hypothetical protein
MLMTVPALNCRPHSGLESPELGNTMPTNSNPAHKIYPVMLSHLKSLMTLQLLPLRQLVFGRYSVERATAATSTAAAAAAATNARRFARERNDHVLQVHAHST